MLYTGKIRYEASRRALTLTNCLLFLHLSNGKNFSLNGFTATDTDGGNVNDSGKSGSGNGGGSPSGSGKMDDEDGEDMDSTQESNDINNSTPTETGSHADGVGVTGQISGDANARKVPTDAVDRYAFGKPRTPRGAGDARIGPGGGANNARKIVGEDYETDSGKTDKDASNPREAEGESRVPGGTSPASD